MASETLKVVAPKLGVQTEVVDAGFVGVLPLLLIAVPKRPILLNQDGAEAFSPFLSRFGTAFLYRPPPPRGVVIINNESRILSAARKHITDKLTKEICIVGLVPFLPSGCQWLRQVWQIECLVDIRPTRIARMLTGLSGERRSIEVLEIVIALDVVVLTAGTTQLVHSVRGQWFLQNNFTIS